MMNLLDQIMLLLTGLVAIYLVWQIAGDYRRNEPHPVHDLFYMAAFVVLLVDGLMMIFMTYGILENPAVVVVSYLIPLGLSLGLVSEFHKRFQKTYLIIGLIGIFAIAVTRVADTGLVTTFVLAGFHTVAAFIVIFVPAQAIKAGLAPKGFAMVSVGGILISIGGIALAFLKSGKPILSAEIIFMILAPLLFLMTVAFSLGFISKIRNSQ